MKTLRALELFSDYVNGEIVTLFTGNEITVPDADAEVLLASGRFEDVTPAPAMDHQATGEAADEVAEKPLNEMTKAELAEVAFVRGVEVNPRMNKADIIAAIKAEPEEIP